MERIKLSNIIKKHGDRKIFEISDLVIQDKQKIGIVGKNGIGKSTFLNIISGDRLTKLDSEIALENDSAKRLLLEKEREEILSKLKNS